MKGLSLRAWRDRGTHRTALPSRDEISAKKLARTPSVRAVLRPARIAKWVVLMHPQPHVFFIYFLMHPPHRLHGALVALNQCLKKLVEVAGGSKAAGEAGEMGEAHPVHIPALQLRAAVLTVGGGPSAICPPGPPPPSARKAARRTQADPQRTSRGCTKP